MRYDQGDGGAEHDSACIAKKEIRRRAADAVERMSPSERVERSAAAQDRLSCLPAFDSSRTIMVYHALPDEVDTTRIIELALRRGKRVALPKTFRESLTMLAMEVRDLSSDLSRGPSYGIMEPREGLPIVEPAEIELVVVPGRAFDRSGHRLGRGAGYYDRYMVAPGFRAVKAALAFDCQVFDAVPSRHYDVPVDFIITESRAIDCRAELR
jgi:5-formyltetrahydrofolate cyclo-ligase